MEYKIIATLGPGSSREEVWKGMLAAGATSFRLNTSHLTIENLDNWLDRLGEFFAILGRSVPIILDLQGSKWRIGEIEPFELTTGQKVTLLSGNSSREGAVLPVPHEEFFKAALVSDGEIILNDAKLRLKIETVKDDWIEARIIQGGEISSHKGITFQSCDFRKEALSVKDQAIVDRTREFRFIQYAVSYVRDAIEMEKYRSRIGESVCLIAKLEREQAMKEAMEISRFANEMWVCRGDLGAELGIRLMAETTHHFAGKLKQFQIPVVLAGQVLEHMTEKQIPTRSEVAYLYDALCAGYKGVVLSDEAAVGRYPIESCRIAAMFKD